MLLSSAIRLLHEEVREVIHSRVAALGHWNPNVVIFVLGLRFLDLFEQGLERLVDVLLNLLISAQYAAVGNQDDSLVFHKLDLEQVAAITLQIFCNLNA